MTTLNLPTTDTIRIVLSFIFTAMIAANAFGGNESKSAAAPEADLVARVGNQKITRDDLETAVLRATRKRFYHARPPAEQLDQFRRQVAEDLVTRALLLEEASRLNIRPDQQSIKMRLDGYEQRYANSPRWKTEGAEMLSSLRRYLEDQDRLQKLEARVKTVPRPSESILLRYYRDNPEKFTEPQRQRVSVILLQVDPSSTKMVWDAALKEGATLVARIKQGAGFAELARMHSADATAANGGDMGYLHTGMLSPQAEAVIANLETNEISAPTRLLEGIAIFKVTERLPARLREFADVRERCESLWTKEQADNAWMQFVAGLRKSIPVEIFDPAFKGSARFQPAPQVAGSDNSSSN